VAIAVIIDKKNSETITGVPVNSLIKLARVD
jgi:orotate phosphoribosyltransferase